MLVVLGTVLAVALTSGRAVASPIFYGPTPYLGFSDSPFSGSGVYVESFEDGLNTPGVIVSGGSAINGPYVDSIGSDGHSWYSNFVLDSFTFTFDAAVIGGLPTLAGLVLTDVGYNAATPYFANFLFEAFGPGGVSLGSIGPYYMGDGQDTGQTAEDRFFGVMNPGGISAIRISTDQTRDWEIDHLQYGSTTTVPEPSSLMLVGTGIVGLVCRYRRRKRAEGADQSR
jgi:hypothetical protein